MANTQAGISGAATGAQVGGQVGGGYGALIGGVIGGVMGLVTAHPDEARLEAQRLFNKEVVTNTVTDLFDRQRAQQIERMRTARALQNYQAQGKTQISTVRANFGAADMIGSSANALAQAIDYQTKQAEAVTLFNYGVGFDNYLTNINQITNRGSNQLQRTVQSQEQRPMDFNTLWSTGTSMYNSAMSGQSQGSSVNYGLQFGSTVTPRANTMQSNFSTGANLNLSYGG